MQSSFTHLIFLVPPAAWGWLSLSHSPVEGSSWDIRSGGHEERIWGLLQRELDARARQELPIFSVIKITNRAQPKPGIA